MGDSPKKLPEEPSPLFALQRQLTLEKEVGEKQRQTIRDLERRLATATDCLQKHEPEERHVVVLRDTQIAGVPKGIGEPVARVRLGAGFTLHDLASLIADGSAGEKGERGEPKKEDREKGKGGKGETRKEEGR